MGICASLSADDIERRDREAQLRRQAQEHASDPPTKDAKVLFCGCNSPGVSKLILQALRHYHRLNEEGAQLPYCLRGSNRILHDGKEDAILVQDHVFRMLALLNKRAMDRSSSAIISDADESVDTTLGINVRLTRLQASIDELSGDLRNERNHTGELKEVRLAAAPTSPVLRSWRVAFEEEDFEATKYSNAQYFLNADTLGRVLDYDYVATEEDVLRSHTISTGVVVTEVEMPAEGTRAAGAGAGAGVDEDGAGGGGAIWKMQLYDLATGRNQRRKWIYVVDGVDVLVYVVDLTAYQKAHVMEDSINVCTELIKMIVRYTARCRLLVVFTRPDLMCELMVRKPINKVTMPGAEAPLFGDFEGTTVDDAADYFHRKHLSCLKTTNGLEKWSVAEPMIVNTVATTTWSWGDSTGRAAEARTRNALFTFLCSTTRIRGHSGGPTEVGGCVDSLSQAARRLVWEYSVPSKAAYDLSSELLGRLAQELDAQERLAPRGNEGTGGGAEEEGARI